MQRTAHCDATRSSLRQKRADAHNRQESIDDPDSLADQQLYIQGKMEIDEYQDYLLFKHSPTIKPHA